MNNQFKNSSSPDEWVLVLQPVMVRRKDIFSPSMTACPQPIPVVPDETPAPRQPHPRASLTEHKQRTGMASGKQKDYTVELINRHNLDGKEVLKMMGIESFDQMTNEQANKFISEYKDKDVKPESLF